MDAKLAKVRATVATNRANKPPPSFFQSLFPCLANPRFTLSTPRLIGEQERLLALALFRYDEEPQIFHEILAEAYIRLTGNMGPVYETGAHWEEIGF